MTPSSAGRKTTRSTAHGKMGWPKNTILLVVRLLNLVSAEVSILHRPGSMHADLGIHLLIFRGFSARGILRELSGPALNG